jgi:YD repeat-containing protein
VRNIFCGLVVLPVFFGTAPVFAANGSVTYSYDALGRVTSASYDTGVIVYYTYDANGNRTQQVINVNTAGLCWGATGSSCTGSHPVCWATGLWQAATPGSCP